MFQLNKQCDIGLSILLHNFISKLRQSKSIQIFVLTVRNLISSQLMNDFCVFNRAYKNVNVVAWSHLTNLPAAILLTYGWYMKFDQISKSTEQNWSYVRALGCTPVRECCVVRIKPKCKPWLHIYSSSSSTHILIKFFNCKHALKWDAIAYIFAYYRVQVCSDKIGSTKLVTHFSFIIA